MKADSGEWTDLTKEYSVRKGQWVTKAKVCQYPKSKDAVLNITRWQIIGTSKAAFKGKLTIGESFWKEVFGKEGIVYQALQEHRSKAPEAKETPQILSI